MRSDDGHRAGHRLRADGTRHHGCQCEAARDRRDRRLDHLALQSLFVLPAINPCCCGDATSIMSPTTAMSTRSVLVAGQREDVGGHVS